MKCFEITFEGILQALKQQKKFLMVWVAGFTMLGCLAGIIWADDLAASPTGGSVEGLYCVDFADYSYDTDYYATCSNAMMEAYRRACNGLHLLNDASLHSEQKEELKEIQTRLNEVHTSMLLPIWETLSSGVVCVPEGSVERTIQIYEARLQIAQDSLHATQTAQSLLDEMRFLESASTEETTAEGNLLRQLTHAVQQRTVYEQSVERYRRALEQLKEHPEEIPQQNRMMDEMLGNAQTQLNKEISCLQEAIVRISKENSLDVFVFYNVKEDGYHIEIRNALTEEWEDLEQMEERFEVSDDRAVIILHHNGIRSEQEAILLLSLFGLLTGICSGAFFAICRQYKQDQEHEE